MIHIQLMQYEHMSQCTEGIHILFDHYRSVFNSSLTFTRLPTVLISAFVSATTVLFYLFFQQLYFDCPVLKCYLQATWFLHSHNVSNVDCYILSRNYSVNKIELHFNFYFRFLSFITFHIHSPIYCKCMKLK